MTDLEMTKLCAAAMGSEHVTCAPGNQFWVAGDSNTRFDPLHDDAQAMALVKRLKLAVEYSTGHWFVDSEEPKANGYAHDDLNRAIVECVAKMQAARIPTDSPPNENADKSSA